MTENNNVPGGDNNNDCWVSLLTDRPGSLLIQEVRREDSGKYSVLARNRVGGGTLSTQLIVLCRWSLCASRIINLFANYHIMVHFSTHGHLNITHNIGIYQGKNCPCSIVINMEQKVHGIKICIWEHRAKKVKIFSRIITSLVCDLFSRSNISQKN